MSTGSGPEFSPNKRLKTESANADGGGDDDNQPVCCGICYAERGASIAGEIDCCNHYFCFACIMEWAKHESRCPICRQRFSNVCRPPKHGVFSFSRDVKVPLRDQVYHPYGNMTIGPADSHAEAKCSVCLGVTDENLLLLCDLCNTASHTYCVGLGYTVPEGDWFCYDCAISRETNADEESEEQSVVPSVRRAIASQLQQNQSSTPVIPSADRLSRYRGKRPVSNVQRVQRNVQALRDNWNALRSGSMKFHSSSVQSGGVGCRGRDSVSVSVSRGRSDEPPRSLASTSNERSSVRGGPSRDALNERGLKDVEKAWKMMDKAKKMQGTRQRTGRK